MEKEILLNLINKYLSNQATAEEEELLLSYYSTLQKNELKWDELEMGDENTARVELYSKVLSEIKARESSSKKVFFMRRWFIAASVTLLLGVSASLFFYLKNDNSFLSTKNKTQPIKNTIAPGGNKALLTLANGSKIILDDAATGELAKQSGVKVAKAANGQLVYTVENTSSNSATSGPIAYNTIETPKGGQYQVDLPDGSKVWLNAGSSLKYPTNFNGNIRSVQLAGEAYFEVAKNAKKPFRVVSNNQVVEVLGTHFNISSYIDDTSVKTTLLEGSVKVLSTKSNRSKLLKPGEQSNISYLNSSLSVQEVNTEEVVAWKNGYFLFVDEDLKSIMSKFARWYNVDVEYAANVDNLRFGGMVSRSRDLAQALKIIEQTGNIKTKIEGRRVIIMP
ncbi:FecR family protein [Mucilaginibacter sp. OK283]|jgi:ferric-dicitrate binding protein FerR (iron transport regulator)|uniref:FecR family protein n=1 Tax=Mucilaginibacter sp. OK283 TaxID=1881049 RepID=UPI0008CB1E45|nr:FecR domain-containing protein [Mucilaginibacter sp. OK283]SEP32745.1 FecR family protein [Mucilaginibacter sp. OK283]